MPKNDPLKLSQYTLPNAIIENIIDSFQITHSYFSSPIICPTTLKQFSFPFSKDKIFGSIGTTFQHKWAGVGYAHPHTQKDAQQALHWARLAAKRNPDTITILVTTDPNWYHNLNTHEGPFPYSHVISHFKADTIIYDEPTIPPELRTNPRTESHDIRILCIHHKHTSPGSCEYANRMNTISTTLKIPTSFNTLAPPTPINTLVNKNKKWSQLICNARIRTPNPYSWLTIPSYLLSLNVASLQHEALLPQFSRSSLNPNIPSAQVLYIWVLPCESMHCSWTVQLLLTLSYTMELHA